MSQRDVSLSPGTQLPRFFSRNGAFARFISAPAASLAVVSALGICSQLGCSGESAAVSPSPGAGDDSSGSTSSGQEPEGSASVTDGQGSSAGDDAAGDDAAGDDSAGTDSAGTDSAGTDSAGTDSAGDDSADTDSAGDDPAGADSADATGDGAGNAAAGSTAGAGVPTTAANLDCGTLDVSPNVLRRLSRLEYQLSLKELFLLGQRPATSAVPEDSDFKGFRTLAELQNVTTEHLRAYQGEAESLATALLADSERADSVIGCDVASAGCLESFINDFGRLAYRRSLAADEVRSLLALAEEAESGAEQRFTFVVSALLSSASFLFRIEVGDVQDGLSTLAGEELASRLSFALIGRGPSSDLLARGAAGDLGTPDGMLAAAKELLADARSREFFGAFFQQWLGFEKLRAPNEPSAGWNDAIMLSMKEETELFLNNYAWGEGANFLDSLTANHTFIRADLAEFYGLPVPAANGRVDFPEGHDRAYSGLLTHAALISAKNDGDRIAHRGKWVQGTFLCREFYLPTELLDDLGDELEGLTFQQMLDKRNSEAACAGCHAQLDPIGIGFANYDAAGQYDASVDVDAFGIVAALPGVGGGQFETLGELAAMLRGREEVAGCITKSLFLYTGGREPLGPDQCATAEATARFAADQGRFASILEGLVSSPQFRVRRAPAIE